MDKIQELILEIRDLQKKFYSWYNNWINDRVDKGLKGFIPPQGPPRPEPPYTVDGSSKDEYRVKRKVQFELKMMKRYYKETKSDMAKKIIILYEILLKKL